MSVVEVFEIIYDRQIPVYYAGEKVNGTVKLTVKQRVKVKVVKLLAIGDTFVQWSESSNGSSSDNLIHHESHFKNETIFLDKREPHDLYIDPGEHVYQFQISLPSELPSSVSWREGRTKYYCHALVEVSGSSNFNALKSYTVIGTLDLNMSPELRLQKEHTESKTICCLCCKSDPVQVTVRLKKSGFVPGESVNFDLVINNPSFRDIKFRYFCLWQKFMLTSSTGYVREGTNELSRVVANKVVKSHSNDAFDNLKIRIPATCSSSLNKSKAIEVSYVLYLLIEPGPFALVYNMNIPIIVGTVPFSDETNSNRLEVKYEPASSSTGEMIDARKELGEFPSGLKITTDTNTYNPIYPIFEGLS